MGEDYALFSGITGVTEAMFTSGEAGNNAVFSTVTGLQIIKSSNAPHILKQPAGQFVRQGATVTFSFEVLGAAPLSYQWRKNGTPIAGATSPSYTISSVKVDDAGDYKSVSATSRFGSASSIASVTWFHTVPVGTAVSIKFFSGKFGDPGSGWFADNGGGNALQASYWHVGAGKVSPEFGFRGLDATKYYGAYVYGIIYIMRK